MYVFLSCTSTGDTIFLTSLTSAPAEMITVPGDKTFSSPYFCVIDNESLPVGILIPRLQAKSEAASTAAYKRASSPSLRHGHIQLALRDTPSSLSVRGANTMLVSDSAIAITDPAAGSTSATCGAWPIDVAIPALPR